MDPVDFTAIDFSTLGDTFKSISQHMKTGFPLFEEFLEKGQRLHRSLDHMLLHLASFFDGFARIAEHVVHAKGSTREVGTALTNVVMWHRGLEMRLRELSSTMQHKLLVPLNTSLDEWKKLEYSMERENDKELSKAVKEAKEANKGTVKMEKKLAKKDKPGPKLDSLKQQLSQQQQEMETKYTTAIAIARKHLSRSLVEERAWYCNFVGMFNSVMAVETGLVKDMQHFSVIKKDLDLTTKNPYQLLEKSLYLVENVGTSGVLSPERVSSPEVPSTAQSPPPPPPPTPPVGPPSNPSSSRQSPTPSQGSVVSSSTSFSTPEVVPVEHVGEAVQNGYTELRRVITTSPVLTRSPPPHISYLSQPDLQSSPIIQNTPPIVRRYAAASNMNSVGVVASPKIDRRAPPPVSQKPSKLAYRSRAETSAIMSGTSSLSQPDIPRSNSFPEQFSPIEEDSPLLKAIKEQKLKKTITSDRSTPHFQGVVRSSLD